MCSRQSAVSDKVNGLTIYQNCVINVITNESTLSSAGAQSCIFFFLSLVHCTYHVLYLSVFRPFLLVSATISLLYYICTFILTIGTGELQYHLVQLLLFILIFVLCPPFAMLLLDIFFPIPYSWSHILILHSPFWVSRTAVISLYFPVP